MVCAVTHCINVAAGGASFVGRETELAAVRAALRGGSRLVTITGPAGIGKTRLARQVASLTLGQRWCWCDLSEATTLDGACAALARAIAAPIAAAASVEECLVQLAHGLDKLGDVVVLLDNVEQLVDFTPVLLSPCLSLAPHARFLATSRERLRLDEEVVVGLEPLGVSEGVELFVDRARCVRFDFQLGQGEAEVIAAVVEKLEGIPLAIELCAARVGLLSLAQILERLSRRFELLARGSRAAPPRRATLRGALDWSWDLLSPAEKSGLMQCSVFRGSFSLSAAEGVFQTNGEWAPLEVLSSLYEKSLLRAFDVRGVGAGPGERRYRLLESVREYAAQRLEETPAAEHLLERHASFFLRPACGLDEAVTAGHVRALSLDSDNLLSVCMRHSERDPFLPADAGAMLRALLVLEPVMLLSGGGRLEPYIAMFDRALGLPPSDSDLGVFARALYTRAFADLARGRMADAFRLFGRAIDAARNAGCASIEARALSKLAIMAAYAGRHAEASACLGLARPIAEALNRPALSADLLLSSAAALVARGRPHDALESAKRAVDAYETLGDVRGRATALAQLAVVFVSLGEARDALDAATRTLAALDDTEDYRTRAYAYGASGRAHQMLHDLETARERLGEALTVHRAIGDVWCEGVTLGYLGDVELEDGRIEEARRHYTDATSKLSGTGERHYRVAFQASLAVAEALAGRFDAARTTLARAREGSSAEGLGNARALLELRLAHVALLEAGDPTSALRVAHAALALARSPATDGSPGPERCSEDVRFALRSLERLLVSNAGPISSSPPPSSSSLVVGPEARWFRAAEGVPVHLPRSRALRLVLIALTRERIHAPGHALSCQELVAAGWPGERIDPRAAANRLYVTLTKLRRLGLGTVLKSRDDGFLLDPAHVVLEAAA